MTGNKNNTIQMESGYIYLSDAGQENIRYLTTEWGQK